MLGAARQKGRTIVLSIHQPQSKIFGASLRRFPPPCCPRSDSTVAAELFDSVTLLTDGNIVHHGEAVATAPP